MIRRLVLGREQDGKMKDNLEMGRRWLPAWTDWVDPFAYVLLRYQRFWVCSRQTAYYVALRNWICMALTEDSHWNAWSQNLRQGVIFILGCWLLPSKKSSLKQMGNLKKIGRAWSDWHNNVDSKKKNVQERYICTIASVGSTCTE